MKLFRSEAAFRWALDHGLLGTIQRVVDSGPRGMRLLGDGFFAPTVTNFLLRDRVEAGIQELRDVVAAIK